MFFVLEYIFHSWEYTFIIGIRKFIGVDLKLLLWGVAKNILGDKKCKHYGKKICTATIVAMHI